MPDFRPRKHLYRIVDDFPLYFKQNAGFSIRFAVGKNYLFIGYTQRPVMDTFHARIN